PWALETPMAPITWPLTMMGSAPGCGKSFIKVGARFSPLRTILLVSEVGRRRADCRLQAIVGRRRILASQPDQTRPDQLNSTHCGESIKARTRCKTASRSCGFARLAEAFAVARLTTQLGALR